MIVDAHVHFWRYSAAEYGWIDDSMAALRRDFLPDEAAREAATARVDGVIAVQARQSLEETRWLLELADAHPAILGVVGWVDLRADDVREQLASFAGHPKFVGVRHIVQAEPDDRFLLGEAFGRGLAALAEFDLAYDLLIYPRHLNAAAECAARFPRQRFVLDHLAKPPVRAGEIREWERDLHRLAERPNVYAKLSGLVTEAYWQRWTRSDLRPYLDVALECFGADRLLIGSDWPVCTVAGRYDRVMEVFFEFAHGLPREASEAVLGGNAMHFWRLDETLAGRPGATARGRV